VIPKPKPNDAQPERKPDVEPAPAPEPETQTDPALHPGPDRNVMLRVVIREVLEMREEDGPQRNAFKGQIAAYTLIHGPKLERACRLPNCSKSAPHHRLLRRPDRIADGSS
jgi:hypothetical protein